MTVTKDDFNKIWASTSSVPTYTFSDTDYQNGWEFVGNLPPTRAMWDEIQRKNDEKMQLLYNGASFFVDSVADLRTANASIGEVYATKGYYTENDGGNGFYVIRADNSDTDDGGSTIILDNGNVAELITDGTVNVKQFGAKGDGSTDETTPIRNAINSNATTVIVDKGTFVVKDTLRIPSGKNLVGYGIKSILKRVATSTSNTNFLLVGGNCVVSDLYINVGNETGGVFDGGVIVINDTTLNDVTTTSANANIKIRNVSLFFGDGSAMTNPDTSFLQVSLANRWSASANRDGVGGITLENCVARCASGTTLGYYIHSFLTDASFWVNSITVVGGTVSNTRWVIFPYKSDTDYSNSGYYAHLSVYCSNLTSQAGNNVKAVCLLDSNCEFSFSSCKWWDYSSYNKKQYYFKQSLIRTQNSSANIFADTNFSVINFCGIEDDGTEVSVGWQNLSLICRYVSPHYDVALAPKIFNFPYTTKCVRIYKGNVPSGGQIYISFFYKYTENPWSPITINYTGGGTPKIVMRDGTISGVLFGYKIAQTGTTYTLEMYLYKPTNTIPQITLLSLPYNNNTYGYDNSGTASNRERTINMDMFEASEIYLTEPPADIVQVVASDVSTRPLFISGTDGSGNAKLYHITVENGTITLTPWYYNY